MARSVIKLVSLAGTGYFYTTRKNPKTATTTKLLLRKYDPVLRRHTLFRVRLRGRSAVRPPGALALRSCSSLACASRALCCALRSSRRVDALISFGSSLAAHVLPRSNNHACTLKQPQEEKISRRKVKQ